MLLVRERQPVQPEHSVQRLHSIPQSGRFVKGDFQKNPVFLANNAFSRETGVRKTWFSQNGDFA